MGLKKIEAKRAELTKQIADLKEAGDVLEGATAKMDAHLETYRDELETVMSRLTAAKKAVAREVNSVDVPDKELAKIKLEILGFIENGVDDPNLAAKMTSSAAKLIEARISSLRRAIDADLEAWLRKNVAKFPKKLEAGMLFQDTSRSIIEVVDFEVFKHAPPHKPSYESVTVTITSEDGKKTRRDTMTGDELKKCKFLKL